MSHWHPIETAPRDGSLILCWPRDDEHATARWGHDRWVVSCCDQGHYEITHWQPLPAALTNRAAKADVKGPSLTARAAEALKPFVDAAIAYERLGTLDREAGVAAYFETAQWRELLAALRESQLVAEGIE